MSRQCAYARECTFGTALSQYCVIWLMGWYRGQPSCDTHQSTHQSSAYLCYRRQSELGVGKYVVVRRVQYWACVTGVAWLQCCTHTHTHTPELYSLEIRYAATLCVEWAGWLRSASLQTLNTPSSSHCSSWRDVSIADSTRVGPRVVPKVRGWFYRFPTVSRVIKETAKCNTTSSGSFLFPNPKDAFFYFTIPN